MRAMAIQRNTPDRLNSPQFLFSSLNPAYRRDLRCGCPDVAGVTNGSLAARREGDDRRASLFASRSPLTAT
jgi:hypothetical protein